MDYVIFTDTSANLPDKVVREDPLLLLPAGASGGDSLPRLGGV